MTTMEEHIANIKAIPGFQQYEITHWDSYSATIIYWVNGVKTTKQFVDTGNDNWVEVQD